MDALGGDGLARGASGDGLDALAVTIAHEPERVRRERGPSAVVAQHGPDPVEVRLQPRDTIGAQLLIHAPFRSRRRA